MCNVFYVVHSLESKLISRLVFSRWKMQPSFTARAQQWQGAIPLFWFSVSLVVYLLLLFLQYLSLCFFVCSIVAHSKVGAVRRSRKSAYKYETLLLSSYKSTSFQIFQIQLCFQLFPNRTESCLLFITIITIIVNIVIFQVQLCSWIFPDWTQSCHLPGGENLGYTLPSSLSK